MQKSPSHQSSRDSGPWYKERWPWLLMLGPALVVIAGLATFYLAVDGSDGVVHDDYYKRGKMINQTIARDEHARVLGISAEMQLKDGHVTAQVSAHGALPPTLVLRLIHPTQAQYDHTVMLTAQGADGVYQGQWPAKLEAAPRWTVQLEDSLGAWRVVHVQPFPVAMFTMTAL